MEISKLFNLDAMKQLCQGQKHFADGATGSMLARSLEHVDPNIFTKRYPSLAFVNSGFDVDNSGGYSTNITSRRTEPQGEFKVAGDDAKDKGKISMSAERSTISVLPMAAEAAWTDDDVRTAEMEGRNIVQEFIEATNYIYLTQVDKIGFLGVGGNKGLLNNAAFNAEAAAGAIGGLTGAQMYDELAELISDQRDAVKDTPEYLSTRAALATHVYQKIRVTHYNPAADTPMTVLAALQKEFPEVLMYQTHHATNAGGTGVSHTVAYSVTRDSAVMRIPVPLQYSEIVRNKFVYEQGYKFRIAGLDILEPLSGRIMTGL
jgi:hypothetical protein